MGVRWHSRSRPVLGLFKLIEPSISMGGNSTASDSRPPRDPPPNEAVTDPTLGRLLVGANVLRRSASRTRPWILAKEGRLLLVHDLREAGPAERRRLTAEAEMASQLDKIAWLAPVLAVREEESWLIVEQPLPGESLAAHLARSDSDEEPRLPAERYAALLAGVAQALEALHERGLVHGDVTPDSLFLAAENTQLTLAAPAIARAEAAPLDDPYVAPEQHQGEVGASIDQYALGIVAREIFASAAAPPLTAPLHQALRHATAPRPADRFGTAAEFGAAIEAAVRREAPHRLADRLAAASPAARSALAPAALVAILIVATSLGDGRDPVFGPAFAALFVPLAIAGGAGLAWLLVWLAGSIPGRRPASLLFVGRPWVAPAVLAVLAGIRTASGGDPTADWFWIVVGVFALRSRLATPSERAGSWLIDLLRHWNRRRFLPPGRRRLVSAGVPAALIAIVWGPAIVGAIWPRSPELPSSPANEYAPMIVVNNFRAALGNHEYDKACRQMLTPEAAGAPRQCRDTLRFASAVQNADPATQAETLALGEQGSLDWLRMQEIPTPSDGRAWTVVTPDPLRVAGAMFTVGQSDDRIEVMLSRRPPRPRSERMRSTWLYELERYPELWRIGGFRACTLPPPGDGRFDARCIVRDRLPERYLRVALAKLEETERQ